MRIIIVGCGRVGSEVARLLDSEGHEVTVVDNDPNVFLRLGPTFKGRKIQGIGFDREILYKAGIEHAEAFVATSSSDNANIIAARIARNIFHVPRVITRLYEPSRGEIYRRFGLLTISSTTWGAERIRELLVHAELDPRLTFGNGEVCLISIETPPHLINRFVKDLNVPGQANVIAIVREDKAFIPSFGTELHDGDVIHMVIQAEAMDRIKDFLGLGEGG
jgi:trk system potassium uptake protein TrkA